MQPLTDLADLAVLLPLGVCVAGWLWGGGWGRGAALWLGGLLLVLGVMLAAKLVLLGCTRPGAMLASPSGHTAAAAYVYGGMAALVLRVRLPAALLLGLGVAALVGLSRVALHAHSAAEVLAGAAVGVGVLCAYAWLSGPAPAGLRPRNLLFVAAPLLIVLHGFRLNAEPRLRMAAWWLGLCF